MSKTRSTPSIGRTPASANQLDAVVQIVGLRGTAGLFSHALFSAIYGAGLVYLVRTITTRPQRWLGLGLILLAMLVHGVWEAAVALAGSARVNTMVVMLVLGLVELVIIIALWRKVAGGARSWIRDLMARSSS